MNGPGPYGPGAYGPGQKVEAKISKENYGKLRGQ